MKFAIKISFQKKKKKKTKETETKLPHPSNPPLLFITAPKEMEILSTQLLD